MRYEDRHSADMMDTPDEASPAAQRRNRTVQLIILAGFVAAIVVAVFGRY